MPIDQPQLWARIERFALDEPGAALSFTRRLAREQGWSRPFTRRAILEYRRFVYLAMTAGHPVCPSDAVDEVWHLHLTCTRSYWDHFCPEVLGRPLHHDPTRGGPAEHEKHLRMYEQTLESYRRTFDAPPPAEVWPSATERFRRRDFQRLDRGEHWLIPPRPALRSMKTAVVALAAVALAGCSPVLLAMTNPLDWTGPEFLRAYLILAGITLAAALAARWGLRATRPVNLDELQPSQLAYLAHNRVVAMNSAVAALAHAGSLQLVPDSKTTWTARPGDQELRATDHLQQAVYATVAASHSIRLRDLYARLDDEADLIDEDLTDRGYLVTPGRAALARLLPAAMLSAVLALGAAKIYLGLSRDRPVGWLILIAVPLLLVTLYMLARHERRSLSTGLALRSLRWSNRTVRKAVQTRKSPIEPGTVAMAVALFGIPALADGPLSRIGGALHEETPKRSGFDWGFTSGCGGSCGASGCGGGGCGGGGCGGCGGG